MAMLRANMSFPPYRVDSNSPLSRYFVFNPPLTLGTKNGQIITSPSLHHAYWYLMLLQIESNPGFDAGGKPKLSDQLLNDNHLRNNPLKICGFLSKNKVSLSATATIKTNLIYRNLIVHVAAQNAAYRNIFETIEADCPRRYFCFGTDRKYCTGLTSNQFRPGFVTSGMNAWGRILDDAAAIIRSGFKFKSRAPDGDIPFNLLKNPKPMMYSYPKSVLLITDSYGKFLKGISGGDFVRVGGGTFAKLADAVRQAAVNLSDYHFIIVVGGLNEVRKSPDSQRRSWADFLALMSPEINRRHYEVGAETILFSLTPPLPQEHRLPAHYSWMRDNLDGTGVSVLEWSNPYPFVDNSGNQQQDLFEPDHVHLNPKGFRQLWWAWTHILSGLEFIGFELGAESYLREKQQRNNGGQVGSVGRIDG